MSEQKRIRVLIVDDHALVRKGIGLFISAYGDLQLVGEGSSGNDAVVLCNELNPDVILMDLMMPGMDGVTAIRCIREQYCPVQIVVLTSFDKEELVKEAIKAGAIGYLLKNVSADELAEAIRAAALSQPTLSKEATQILMNTLSIPEVEHHSTLTDSEQRVLGLMVEGYNNAQIAESLGVSLSTVKTHASNLFSKLGVTSRVEAVSLALKQHLV